MQLSDIKQDSPEYAKEVQDFIYEVSLLFHEKLKTNPVVVTSMIASMSINIFMNLYINNEKFFKKDKFNYGKAFARAYLPFIELYEKFDDLSAKEFLKQYIERYKEGFKDLNYDELKKMLKNFRGKKKDG